MPMGAKEEKDVVFWMTFLWFLGYAAGLLSPKGVNFEVQALMDIKTSLKDPRGSLQNWDKDSVDPCSWTMVTCSSQNLVIGLGAPSQSLSGSLSPSIGNLSNLEIVLLQNNEISGSITKEIGKLKKLRTLDLSCNHFSGEIPTSLGQLRNLQYLRLNNNSLSGRFPESLANITELSFLDLSFNNLTGPSQNFLQELSTLRGILLSVKPVQTKNAMEVSPYRASLSRVLYQMLRHHQSSKFTELLLHLGLALD
ncbi:hypothetical protein HPP92_008855 [Vanilla planifolia]|uniref:Leucine-rich repeat-containing N-terminal plant-type domain-containing protein n=1 Tax=Vanilla planifolia TaxID=51239 RepID=A0A835R374_VANPL|nr:hypothetical protein HPP92_008855 [Vanilla planifolia]